MVKWFDRTPREALAPLLRTRSAHAEGNRVLLEDLRPDFGQFIGQAASLQLAVMQQASKVVAQAPTLDAKAHLADVVRIVSNRYRALSDLATRSNLDPIELMRPYIHSSERFAKQTAGNDWYELLLSLHVTTGLLTDFFVSYAGGLAEDERGPVVRAIQVETGHPIIVRELQHAIDDNPRLASRLAMWGRRLVGDTLLQMYLAIEGPEQQGFATASGARLEPAFHDIIATHTRRMDALGLTA